MDAAFGLLHDVLHTRRFAGKNQVNFIEKFLHLLVICQGNLAHDKIMQSPNIYAYLRTYTYRCLAICICAYTHSSSVFAGTIALNRFTVFTINLKVVQTHDIYIYIYI